MCPWTNLFVELDKSIHDRASFDCGEEELNRFLQTQAAKNRPIGFSRTMVLADYNPLPDQTYPIKAFYSVTLATIHRQTLPAVVAKKLPLYPIPVFLLALLAVAKTYQGLGIGKITLTHALHDLWVVNDHMPAYAIVVDCLTTQVESFYIHYGGFELLDQHNGRTRLFFPMKNVARLFDVTEVLGLRSHPS